MRKMSPYWQGKGLKIIILFYMSDYIILFKFIGAIYLGLYLIIVPAYTDVKYLSKYYNLVL